ncbi:hypothetical protein [Winogradskyella ursingii]|uniref:hypothetical protein n=1 Tax=Winogradskyella ursingii TaxID=2686079 RepID=UPI0015CEBBF7|nr:hypothetical protein [Winogradskyella ursingii]
MNNYNNIIEFEFSDSSRFKRKLEYYFDYYNFDQIENNKNEFVFEKKWSLSNGWKFNPLDWETTIKIKLIENRMAIIKYDVISNGVLSSVAFSSLFETFICNLEKFINQEIDFKKKNIKCIRLAKQKVYKYHGILIVGIISGLSLGVILTNLTGKTFFGTLGVVMGAIITEKLINSYLLKQYLVRKAGI